MAVNIDFQTQGQNQAAREILDIRDSVQLLTKEQIALRRAYAEGTAEQRRSIRTQQESLRIRTAELRALQGDINLRKQRITQLIREQRQVDANTRREEAALRRLSRERIAFFDQATFAGETLFRVFSRVTTSIVQSAASFETFRTSITAIQGSVDAGNVRFAQLLDLTEELVGIDTGNLISFANRFDAIGLSAEQTDAILRGVVRSQGELGKVGAVNVRILTQLSQAISSNRIQGQDLLPIVRELPRFWQQASEALMTNVTSLEELRSASSRFGGAGQTLVRIFTHIGLTSRGIDLATFTAQMDILRDRSLRLAATLGTHVLPAFTRMVSILSGAVQGIENWSNTSQSILAWTIVVASAGTAIVTFGRIVGFVFGPLVTAILPSLQVAWTSLTARIGALLSRTQTMVVASRDLSFTLTAQQLPLRELARNASLVTASFFALLGAWNEILSAFRVNIDFGLFNIQFGEDRIIPESTIERVRQFDLTLSQTGRTIGFTNDQLRRIADSSATYNDEALRLVRTLQRADRLRGALRRAVNTGQERERILELRRELQFALSAAETLRNSLREGFSDILRRERLPITFELAADAALRARDAFQEALNPPVDAQSDVQSLIANVDREYRTYGRAVQEEYQALLDGLGEVSDENRAEFLRISLERERELDQIIRQAGVARERIRSEFNAAELREEEQQTQDLLSADQRRFRERINIIIQGRRNFFRAQQLPLDRSIFDAENAFRDALTGGDPDEIIRQRENLFAALNALERSELEQFRNYPQQRLEIADRFARRRVIIARDVQSALIRIGEDGFEARLRNDEREVEERLRVQERLARQYNQAGREIRDEEQRISNLRNENEREAADISFRIAVESSNRQNIIRANDLQREVAYRRSLQRIAEATTPEDREAARLAGINELDRIAGQLEGALEPLNRAREREQQISLDNVIRNVMREESEYVQSLRRRERFYRRFSRDIVSLGEDLVRNRGANFREIVTEFVASTVRQIAQQRILELFLTDSDNRITALKIANLRRIEDEQRRLGGLATIPNNILDRGTFTSQSGFGVGSLQSLFGNIISINSAIRPIIRDLLPLAGLLLTFATGGSFFFHDRLNDLTAAAAGSRIGRESAADFSSNFASGFSQELTQTRSLANQITGDFQSGTVGSGGTQQVVVVDARINWNPNVDTPEVIRVINEAVSTGRGVLRTR